MPASTRTPSGPPTARGPRPGSGRPSGRPSSRPPARVFWVRRALVLGVLAALVLLGWLVVRLLTSGDEGAAAGADARDGAVVADGAGDGAGDGAAAGAGAQEGAAAATPSPTPTTISGVPVCAADDLEVRAVPTAASFPAGTDPTFTLSVTNTGEDPCLVDAGDAHREVVLTSGTDRVWSPRDCLAEGEGSRLLLLAGGTGDDESLVWDRVRSVPGCAGGQATAGSGTYALTVTVGGAVAQPAVFTLG